MALLSMILSLATKERAASWPEDSTITLLQKDDFLSRAWDEHAQSLPTSSVRLENCEKWAADIGGPITGKREKKPSLVTPWRDLDDGITFLYREIPEQTIPGGPHGFPPAVIGIGKADYLFAPIVVCDPASDTSNEKYHKKCGSHCNSKISRPLAPNSPTTPRETEHSPATTPPLQGYPDYKSEKCGFLDFDTQHSQISHVLPSSNILGQHGSSFPAVALPRPRHQPLVNLEHACAVADQSNGVFNTTKPRQKKQPGKVTNSTCAEKNSPDLSQTPYQKIMSGEPLASLQLVCEILNEKERREKEPNGRISTSIPHTASFPITHSVVLHEHTDKIHLTAPTFVRRRVPVTTKPAPSNFKGRGRQDPSRVVMCRYQG